tara:strand:- start:62 stop:205 length:144 start_codon:yes stop_codon:yes gene_type:complete
MSRQRLNASGDHHVSECAAARVGVPRRTEDAARLVDGIGDSAALGWQ